MVDRYYSVNGVYQSLSGNGSTVVFNDDGTKTEKLVNGDVYIFGQDDYLIESISADKKSYTYSYFTDGNGAGKLESKSNEYGDTVRFEYNAQRLVSKVTDPSNNEYLFEYDSIHNLVKITYPDLTQASNSDNPTTQFLFENQSFPHALTGLIDEKGVRFASWSYDSKGRAISSEHAVNKEKVELDFSVTGETKVKTFTDSTSYYEKTFKYEVHGGERVNTEVSYKPCSTCPVEKTRKSEFNSVSDKIQDTDKNGNVTRYEYDDIGREISRTEAFGTPEETTTTTSWLADRKLPIQVIKGNLEINYEYNADQRVTRVEQRDTALNESRAETTTYNALGLVESIDGPRTDVNDVTLFEYDSQTGLLTSQTSALGQVTTYVSYDALGRPTEIIDANNIRHSMSYHPRGWLLSQTTHNPFGNSSDGLTVRYEYEPTGKVKKITQPAGDYLIFEYDDAQRMVAVSNNLGERKETVYDDYSNVINETIKDEYDNITNTLSNIFDEYARLKSTIGANNQTSEVKYDSNDNPIQNTNPRALQSKSMFDGLDRLQKTIDPLLGEIKYEYDAQSRVTQVTDQNELSTTYSYNAFGNTLALASPDTGETIFTYDEAGNTKTKIDSRGVVSQYKYDALNRLTHVTYPANSSENVMYVYDESNSANFGVGRLTTLVDESGTTSFAYDYRGNVISKTVSLNDSSQSYTLKLRL